MDRRQVFFAATVGKSVKHRANELHQRCLARFIGAVKQRHSFGQRIDRQSGPHAEAINLNVFDLHDRLSQLEFSAAKKVDAQQRRRLKKLTSSTRGNFGQQRLSG